MKVAERKQEHLDENHVTEHVVFVITQVHGRFETHNKAFRIVGRDEFEHGRESDH